MAPRSIAIVAIVLLNAIFGTIAKSQWPESSDSYAGLPRASDSELQAIWEQLGLDRLDAEESERILSIEAYRWSEEEPYELVAFLWFKPVFAQNSICIAREFVSDGRPDVEGYKWSHQERYHHWLGQAESDCEMESREELPQSVVTNERIATDAMIQILAAEGEILKQALSQVDPETLNRDLSGDWRLREVALTLTLDIDLGFAYHAAFRAPGRARGPSCTFTITDGEIVVHSAGVWIA